MTADSVTVLVAGRIGVALARRWLAAEWKMTAADGGGARTTGVFWSPSAATGYTKCRL